MIFVIAAVSLCGLSGVAGENSGISMAALFKDTGFDVWARQGPNMQIPFKLHVVSHGLALQQRIAAHVEIEVPGRELVARAGHERLIALVKVEDPSGTDVRDFGFIDVAEVKPELRKKTWVSIWEAFAVPGDYKVTVGLYDKVTGEHSLQESWLKIDPLKNDPLPELWAGLPKWEFWAPVTDTRDAIYRTDIDTSVHIPMKSRYPVDFEVLADLTPSDLFHGSSKFYEGYLSVMLPLLRELSQAQVEHGSVSVEAVDLRQKRITFSQEKVDKLDWSALKRVLAPENGPSSIDIKGLQDKHQRPDFLREELLRRMDLPGSEEQSGPTPLKVFVVLGSPMDFYAFHQLPPIDASQAEKCVVYYLQFETNPRYADGALGKVRSMLKPLAIHTMKVRSPESVRHALARIVTEVNAM